MALLGLGLIALSFCFFLYKIPPSRWPKYFSTWRTSTNAISSAERKEKDAVSSSTHEPPRVSDGADGGVNDKGSRGLKVQGEQVAAIAPIPLFNLHEAEKDNSPKGSSPASKSRHDEGQPRALPTPTKQTASMPPPPLPSSKSTSLMPPPSVKPSALRPLPKLSGSLVPPPSAASTLRGPPKSTQNGLAIPPSTSTLPPNKRPSRKVLLDPGHSPLDWANLTRNPPNPSFLRGANVPPQLIKVTPSQLKKQNGRKGTDAWGTYQGKVYNLTPYLKFHPGGVGELLRGAGKVGEAERLFVEIHPWVNWDGMLSECLVGILVSEDSIGAQDLEAMD